MGSTQIASEAELDKDLIVSLNMITEKINEQEATFITFILPQQHLFIRGCCTSQSLMVSVDFSMALVMSLLSCITQTESAHIYCYIKDNCPYLFRQFQKRVLELCKNEYRRHIDLLVSTPQTCLHVVK